MGGNAMPIARSIRGGGAPTFRQLRGRSTAVGTQPETVPWWLYDTQTVTDNVTTTATFFAATQANRSLSNLLTGGSLPEPQYLTIFGIYADFINATAARVA
jgi:hypothetical protein